MFDIAGTVELGTICPGTGTWNRLQDGIKAYSIAGTCKLCKWGSAIPGAHTFTSGL